MMKRILAIVAMAPLATFAAPRQAATAKAPVAEEKGEISVGTVEIRGDSNLGLTTGSTKVEGSPGVDHTEISLGATGLYYALPVGPGVLGIGGTLQYKDETTKVSGQKDSTTEFKIGPRAGIDVPLAPRLSGYGFGELVYARLTTAVPGGGDSTANGLGIGLGGGVKFFVNPHLSVNGGLVLDYARLSSSGKTVTDWNFGIQGGLSGYFNLPKQ